MAIAIEVSPLHFLSRVAGIGKAATSLSGRGEGFQMPLALRLTDLRSFTPEDREKAIARLALSAIAPANGQAVATAARIKTFETRYEMTSAQLLGKLSRNELRETADIAEWLFWLEVSQKRDENQARPA
ncbi:MAG: hypothetical protein ACHQ9S_25645 [Candidatus Binatia bacterium]